MFEWASVLKGLFLGGAIIIGIASSYIWKADNPLEESAEVYIYQETGFDVDLTPNSPEPKKD